VVLRKLVFAGKSHVGDIAPSAGFPPDALAQIIYNDEMKARAAPVLCSLREFVRKNAVKNLNELKYSHVNPCFFAQLTHNALLQGFSELKCSARDRPFAAEGLAASANQQSAAILDDHATNAYDGTLGIFAGRGHFRKFTPEQFTIQAAAPRIRVDLGQRGI
jgi:hypothetical protein